MTVRYVDAIVVVVYLIGIAAIGLKLSGRQRSSGDYFVGEGRMSWWAVCVSVVATETSVLTVISIPGGAHSDQGFGNLELAMGYIIGRVVVATLLIPLYKRGGFVSAYQYLGERFGRGLQAMASVTFVFTRLLAEGVRLFAAAIPLGLGSTDNLYPNFILHALPVGISGLLVAGILGAAMGSLSSALNSMSNSTVADLIAVFRATPPPDETVLRLGRAMTLVWAVLMAVFACWFSTNTGNVYLTGLAIAGYTYGALLGAFLLGRLVPSAGQREAMVAFVVTVLVMTFIVRVVRVDVPVPGGGSKPASIAAQWLVPIGVLITLAVGWLWWFSPYRSQQPARSTRDTVSAESSSTTSARNPGAS